MSQIKRIVQRPVRRLFAAWRWQKAALRNSGSAVPVFPTSGPELPPGLKVHLGAGEINLQGWVNVDARAFDHVHVRTTSLALEEFTDGAVAAIYICHVLEHVSFQDADNLLRAWHRKLADGGVLFIAVPDFDALLRIYAASGNDLESIKYPLMGGQGYEYNFHRSVYNRAALEKLLLQAGYVEPAPWQTRDVFGQEIGDWSSGTIKAASGEMVAVSLNLRARKGGSRA